MPASRRSWGSSTGAPARSSERPRRVRGMTTITDVDFVGVPTADLDAAVAFYGDTLGLRRDVHMPERNFAEFDVNGLTLSIYNPAAMGREHNHNPNPIALRVDDVHAAVTELEAK